MADGVNNYKSTTIQYRRWHFRAIGPVREQLGERRAESGDLASERALVEDVHVRWRARISNDATLWA